MIEHQTIIRESIVSLVASHFSSAKVVGCGGFPEALKYLKTHKVDLVISDFLVDGDTVLSFLGKLKDTGRETSCLILSAQDEIQIGATCIRAGASGFVTRSAPLRNFVEGVGQVLEGRQYVSDRLFRALVPGRGSTAKSSPETRLTTRELQIYSLTGGGNPVSVIAGKLGISVKTVESHRENIKNKLGFSSAAQLVASAVRWVDDPGASAR